MLLLTGCLDWFNGGVYWSNDRYEVWENAGDPNMLTLYMITGDIYGVGRVDGVTKIGANDRFIIVESTLLQNPEDSYAYWILDMKKDQLQLNVNEVVEGPLGLEAF